tara:strand:+ start:238 stop:687 length:450 start_codon:yes stop_codon:yes gene_type:complete
MNNDHKINILIKKIKKCEIICDDLYKYIYEEFCKWMDNRKYDFEEILLEGWWIFNKDYMFYRSIYINSTCLRTLYDQETYDIYKDEFKNDEDNKPVIHECTGKLLRRWYNLKDQQKSKERRIIREESGKKSSYLFLLSSDIIKLLHSYL